MSARRELTVLLLLLLFILLLLLLLLLLLNTSSGWLAGVFLKHQVTSHDLRCLRVRRILAVPSKHAVCNVSSSVTPVSANHFSMSFETVPNAPVMTGTTVTLRNFEIGFNSRLGSSQRSLSLCLSLECQMDKQHQ